MNMPGFTDYLPYAYWRLLKIKAFVLACVFSSFCLQPRVAWRTIL